MRPTCPITSRLEGRCSCRTTVSTASFNLQPYVLPVSKALDDTGEFLVGEEKIMDYLFKFILKLQRERYKSVCVKEQIVDDFMAFADAYLKKTVHVEGCSSWYKAGTTDRPVRAIWPVSLCSSAHCLSAPPLKWNGVCIREHRIT